MTATTVGSVTSGFHGILTPRTTRLRLGSANADAVCAGVLTWRTACLRNDSTGSRVRLPRTCTVF